MTPGSRRIRKLARRGLGVGRMVRDQASAALLDRQRRGLLESHAGVRQVAFDGEPLWGRVGDSFTAAGAAAENLGLVADALERAGIAYFVVPGVSRTSWALGVREADREAFLASMRELYAGTVVFAARPRAGGVSDFSLFADEVWPKSLSSAPVMRFGVVRLGPVGQVLGGPQLGCDVEFWQDGAEVLAGPSAEAELARVSPQASADVLADSLVAPGATASPTCCRPRAEAREGHGRRAGPPHLRAVHGDDGGGRDLPHRRRLHLGRRRGPRAARQARAPPRGERRRHRRPRGRGVALHQPRRAEVLAAVAGDVRRLRAARLHRHRRPDAGVAGRGRARHHGRGPQGHLPRGRPAGLQLARHRDAAAPHPGPVGPLPVLQRRRVRRPQRHPQHFFYGNGIARLPFSTYQIGVGAPHPGPPPPTPPDGTCAGCWRRPTGCPSPTSSCTPRTPSAATC